jgi:hypothetical protein
MDLRPLGKTVALSCLIAVLYPAPVTVSGAGRTGAQASGNRGGGRGAPAGTDGHAPRRGTVVRSAPPKPTTARRGRADARILTKRPAVALTSPPDPNPRDAAGPDAAGVPSTASASSESSSIQPLRPSPLPQTSPSSSRGTLRLEIGPATAQLYVDGFYAGTVEEANRAQAGLSLPAGWHRLEIRAPGYVTPAINVTIEANRMVSYHGELTPLRR